MSTTARSASTGATDGPAALPDSRVARAALAVATLSLLLSGWSVVQELDDAARDRTVQQRLLCLERPGPNDCGLDQR